MPTPRTGTIPCPACGGSGTVKSGPHGEYMPCADCGGSGSKTVLK